jgi:hypothetical protein
MNGYKPPPFGLRNACSIFQGQVEPSDVASLQQAGYTDEEAKGPTLVSGSLV